VLQGYCRSVSPLSAIAGAKPAACYDFAMASEQLLTAEQAAFIESGLSVNIGTCDQAGIPWATRGMAARMSADRRLCTVWFAESQSGELARALRASRRIAVVLSLPSSHRTLQLKGSDAIVEPLDPADTELLSRQFDGFAADLAQIGFDRPFALSLLAALPSDIVTARFTVAQGFIQTPGPAAGQPLKASA
jgi:hypothetical protein